MRYSPEKGASETNRFPRFYAQHPKRMDTFLYSQETFEESRQDRKNEVTFVRCHFVPTASTSASHSWGRKSIKEMVDCGWGGGWRYCGDRSWSEWRSAASVRVRDDRAVNVC
uniref:Uncharacterized protein n=1 Tax=Setaria digitata TaxID=48799 RepID=A0A915PIZ2_9BILA